MQLLYLRSDSISFDSLFEPLSKYEYCFLYFIYISRS